MSRSSTVRGRLHLYGNAGCERIAMAAAAAAGHCVGLPQSRLADIRTAVAEACLNGLEHGHEGESRGHIDISFGVRRDSFRVIIRDSGRGFNPERVAQPSLDEALGQDGWKRGWGLFLMKQLADKVDVRVGRTGCAVELQFSLESEVG